MRGRNTVLIGAQWGDEGKGKVIDVLTERADWVVRYQGGSNAGHTVEIGDARYVLHLVPSGIFREDCRCVIGNGVVLDPVELLQEIDGVRKAGFSVENRLFISDRAHLVMPWHRALDAGRESRLSAGRKIGTTQRGIGPAYTEKMQRSGLRGYVLTDPHLDALLRTRFDEANAVLRGQGLPELPAAELIPALLNAARALAPMVTDTTTMLYEANDRGEAIFFEGAQGTMLDVDFGSYPFVTSSSTTAGGACTGTGLPPGRMDRIVGVLKAYTTRVGEGPFPTELTDATGERLRAVGREFGATTGRPRRCGWFDAVVARHAARINGLHEWALTKLDVLDDLPVIRVCTAYLCDGERIETVPADPARLARCTPVYTEVPGWAGPIRGAGDWFGVPEAARDYVRFLEECTGVPVRILSLGPNREDTLVLDRKPPARRRAAKKASA
jgi:adenylosuccinate synthase